MTFVWIDDKGQRRELMDPQAIVAEAEAVAREIDGFAGLLDSDDRSMRDLARKQIAPLDARLDRLIADLERWNAHATATTSAAALELAEKVRGLPDLLARVILVVDLHDEHESLLKETAGDPTRRAALLAKPMTQVQARAVAVCDSRTPPATATRDEARAWLDGYPQFRRQRHGDGGWFAWTDIKGHAHRLVDPLSIEIEMAEISGDLGALRPRLLAEGDPAKLLAAVNRASTLWERLANLQRDLERFESEADARDRTECSKWAADWRAKRKPVS